MANGFKLAVQKSKKVVSVLKISMGMEQLLYWLVLCNLITMEGIHVN